MRTRRLLVDLSPLSRHRDFRRLMTAQLCSSFASQFVAVAVPLQVYEQSHHSTLQVGLVSLVQLIPNLAGAMLGGMIADTHDRKVVMWVMQALLSLTYVGFTLNAASHTAQLWPLYLIAAVSAGISGIAQPARWAVVPVIVGAEDIAPASSIMQIVSNVTMVAGPSLGGLLLAQIGFAHLYELALVGATASIFLLLAMSPLAPAEGGRRVSVAAMIEGFRYLHKDKVLSGSFYLDFEAMVFGMPRAVFPALAITLYHGGAATYGLLSAAPAAGALISAMVSGWVNNVRRQGLGIVICVLIWGTTIGLVGVIKLLWVGLVLLAIAGGADMVSVVFRNTVLQTTVPDHIRGRMTASFLALAMAGNRLGDTEAGVAASIAGAQFAVWSGGLACIVGALLFAWRVPELLSYDQQRAVREMATR